MKTKELIEALKDADPSGELEVIAGSDPIYFVETQEAYYDGMLPMLVQDHTKGPYYNIVGFKYTPNGGKVRLHLMDLDSCILNDPEIPLDLSEVPAHSKQRYFERAEKKRTEIREIIRKVESEIKP